MGYFATDFRSPEWATAAPGVVEHRRAFRAVAAWYRKQD